MGRHSARCTTLPSTLSLSPVGTKASGSAAVCESTAKVWLLSVVTTNLFSLGMGRPAEKPVEPPLTGVSARTNSSASVKDTLGLALGLRAMRSLPTWVLSAQASHRSAMYLGTLTSQTPRAAFTRSTSLSDFLAVGVTGVASSLAALDMAVGTHKQADYGGMRDSSVRSSHEHDLQSSGVPPSGSSVPRSHGARQRRASYRRISGSEMLDNLERFSRRTISVSSHSQDIHSEVMAALMEDGEEDEENSLVPVEDDFHPASLTILRMVDSATSKLAAMALKERLGLLMMAFLTLATNLGVRTERLRQLFWTSLTSSPSLRSLLTLRIVTKLTSKASTMSEFWTPA
eukprot:maker-scaffold521_size146803-snap-gene-0.15 protein:Tk12191 transcript:maker-scaffold521_size146803-snap-gene-0.15-mRNA-1 annotation:"molecular chaperone"